MKKTADHANVADCFLTSVRGSEQDVNLARFKSVPSAKSAVELLYLLFLQASDQRGRPGRTGRQKPIFSSAL
jgi:hypothetical protein